MPFYDLTKQDRSKLVVHINTEIYNDLIEHKTESIMAYFSDEDTYIRKTAYLTIGRLYKTDKKASPNILQILKNQMKSNDGWVRPLSSIP